MKNITRTKLYTHFVHSDAQKARARFVGVSYTEYASRY